MTIVVCVCGFVCRKRSNGYAFGGIIVTRKTRINWLNEKRSLILWGLGAPIWTFCSKFCGFPNCLDR